MPSTNIIRDPADLEALGPDWDRLAGNDSSPLLRHAWFMACAESRPAGQELHVVTVWQEGRLQAAAPLVAVRRRGSLRLELLGASVLHEPSGLLYADRDALRYLCGHLADGSRTLALARLTDSAVVADALRQSQPWPGKTVLRPASGAPYVAINGSWEDYHASLSARRRYDLRRARRRLEERGKPHIEIVRPSEESLEPLLETAFRVESSGWKGRSGTALLHNPAVRRFFHRYCRRACQAGELRLAFMRLGGDVPIAMQVGLESAGRYWVLKIGYDEAWAHASPGMQLTAHTIRYAFESGCRSYEFLGTEEPWIWVWTRTAHPCSTLVRYPLSWNGGFSLAGDVLDWAWRRLVRSADSDRPSLAANPV